MSKKGTKGPRDEGTKGPGSGAIDRTGAPPSLSYCTNVHPGVTLEANLAQLDRHATAVRQRLGVETFPIGWWIAQPALAELVRGQGEAGLGRLGAWFRARGLQVATINGFPYGDFHERVVKHRVYLPDWSMPERGAYTRALAELLVALRPDAEHLSISTLPIGWPTDPDPSAVVAASARQLVGLVEQLVVLRERSGVRVHVDLEPEPGCLLQRSADVVSFFADHLLPAAERRGVEPKIVRDHVGVCHDVCHAAVMFEAQGSCFDTYAAAGIRVGKVQVSSAVETDFEGIGATERSPLLERLASFAEERYLHQTTIRVERDGAPAEDRFYEDLPLALASAGADRPPHGVWRTHFHVPVFLRTLGHDPPVLGTTQGEIAAALAAVRRGNDDPTIEVETYAWGVLPTALQPDSLAEGIAEELRWVQRALADADASP
ncbi:MAG: metabolite traffic protein EboE [Phycisphaerales bacterium]|nr:metabolite traffic protein EboE [Phycisphaerales bacterium]